MDDPLARHRFREHCELIEGGVELFDSWLDLRSLCTKVEAAEVHAVAVQDLYLAPGAPLQFPLSREEKDQLREGTTVASGIGSLLDGPQKRLLDELFSVHFASFLKYKMIEVASVRLGRFDLTEQEREGLGDCLCL